MKYFVSIKNSKAVVKKSVLWVRVGFSYHISPVMRGTTRAFHCPASGAHNKPLIGNKRKAFVANQGFINFHIASPNAGWQYESLMRGACFCLGDVFSPRATALSFSVLIFQGSKLFIVLIILQLKLTK